MENKAAKTRAIEIAFIVDADLLRRLETILKEVGGTLEYTVKFSDGSSVQYADMKDVIDQPNSARRAIASLIAGASGDGQSAYVTLRNNPAPPVEYTVNGSQRNVIYFGDQLDDWAAATRQWYSIFSSNGAGFVIGMGALIFPLWLVGRIPAAFLGLTGSWIPAAALVVVGIAEYWLFKVFIKGTFAIGQGAKRHQFLEYVRGTLLAAFIISFLAGMLANWVMRHP